MQKKYVYSLVVIGILLAFVFTIGVGYGLYVSLKDENTKVATTLDCFKIYFSETENVSMTNIHPVLNEEGKETSPKTLTITNICSDTKELQLRLNILNTTTVDINGLTIEATGNIEQPEILYNKLKNTKTREENVIASKLIGLIKIEPEETVRTNVKIWFDEKKAFGITNDKVLNAKFELIDTASSIKTTLGETIIANGINENVPNLENIATLPEGIFQTLDNEGTTYYYRGNVSNNYVLFADRIWRIVRINGDNSIRMILDKSIAIDSFSANVNAMDYTGMKYIYNNEAIDNNVNTILINWYNENIKNKGLDSYVANTSFCNDSKNTITFYHTYFSPYTRIVEAKQPTLLCEATEEDFGGVYKQKIGLINADEVMLAGGLSSIENYKYYLNNGEAFYTMSPAEYYNYRAYLFLVGTNGALEITPTNFPSGIRPVINLESTITVDGTGTLSEPYSIDLD